MKKIMFTLACFFVSVSLATAQETLGEERRLVTPATDFFVPHMFLNVQGGVSYNVGEAKFSKLVSPAAQLALGYQFSPVFAARFSVSGWEARNRYAYPEAKYKWNYVQPSLEAMVNLTNLFSDWEPDKLFNLYAFAGVGVAYSFNNDDAVNAEEQITSYVRDYLKYPSYVSYDPFEKLWKDNRWNPVVRAGLGMDFRVNDLLAIGAEVNANMLPDHWNSKKGRDNNRDWQFNALVGLKFTLGKSYGRTEPSYEVVQRDPEYIDMPIEKISFNVNIYFIINQSIIRDCEVPKLEKLLEYLREHPKAFVRLSGFADKDTGTPEINMRLSIERAKVVSDYLRNAGISEARIRRFAKGDKVQPFDIPEDNRVCICFVYDPDNPVPQAFEY